MPKILTTNLLKKQKLLLLRDSHQSTILYIYFYLIFTVHAENFNSKLVQETKNDCFCLILVKVLCYMFYFQLNFIALAENFNNK
jgi:hypothetical protein